MTAAVFGVLTSIYFLIFSTFGWYYLNDVDDIACTDYALTAQFCVFVSTFWTVLPICILCCLYPPQKIDIELDNTGFCTSCGTSGSLIISIVIYIFKMVMSVEMYNVECTYRLGIVIMFEVYLPVIIAFLVLVFMAFTTCFLEKCVPKASSKVVPIRITVEPCHWELPQHNPALVKVVVVQQKIPQYIKDVI